MSLLSLFNQSCTVGHNVTAVKPAIDRHCQVDLKSPYYGRFKSESTLTIDSRSQLRVVYMNRLGFKSLAVLC